jgi:FlaA1/EpsC-like NDP-sugar epimerase
MTKIVRTLFFNKAINCFKLRASKLLISRYANRWVILLIDLFLSAFAFSFSFWIMKTTYAIESSYLPGFYTLFVYLFLCLIVYIFLKLHHGIIRYSSYHEIGRIIAAVIITNTTLYLFLRIAYPSHFAGVLFSFMMKISLFTFFSLIIFRYVIVRIYQSITASFQDNSHSASLMIGIDADSVAIAQMLNNNRQSTYRVVGFISKDENSCNQRILDLPIIYAREGSLQSIIHSYSITSLIFSSQNDFLLEKDGLVQSGIELNLKILLARSPKIWSEAEMNGHKNNHQIRPIQIEDLLGRSEIKIDLLDIKNDIKGKIILVTGAAGSIGSEIVRQVATFEPKAIILLDIAETPLYEIESYMLEHFSEINIITMIGDVKRTECLENLFNRYQPEIIYHAAAYKHVPMMEKHPIEAILTNVFGTKNVANYAVKYKARKFVMISTDKAVNPSNVMGASKRIAEMYVQSLAKHIKPESCPTQFITTRFGNVLGSNGSVIPRFKAQIEAGGPVTVTDKNIIRYFMTIPEACRLVLQASVHGESGEIYLFDMGKPVKIDDLARNMIQLAGLIPGEDIEIIYTGLRPGEKLFEELLTSQEISKPTMHSKIMVAQVTQFQFDKVSHDIDELIELAHKMETLQVVQKMKNLVPEYRSKNSIYEKLDHEKVIETSHEK